MKSVTDDIAEFDSIYRSDGPGYLRFRKHFLKKFEKSLNIRFRENTYIPLRILLLETTRSKAKHSLNDLWLLLHTRRLKAPSVLSISASDCDIIPWHQICSALSAPGPVSYMRFAPFSRERFAFSTLDGSIHFATIADSQIRILSSILIPSVSFLKFEWISETLVIGIGVTSSAFLLNSDSRLYEIQLPAPPSEIVKFPSIPHYLVVGDRSGQIIGMDLLEASSLSQSVESTGGFRQPTSSTLSRIDVNINKIHNAKRPITSLAVVSSDMIICGTSDGDIDIVYVEFKMIKRKKVFITDIKLKSSIRVTLPKVIPGIKVASIDCISGIQLHHLSYLIVNMRSEQAAFLVSDDGFKHFRQVKSVRVPSLRAKCPVSISQVDDKWIFVAGTDMGDLIMSEEGEDQSILTLHETTIAAIEWLKNSRTFLAADVSGLISLWKKKE